jgi:ADP-ribose pyrophosphatase
MYPRIDLAHSDPKVSIPRGISSSNGSLETDSRYSFTRWLIRCFGKLHVECDWGLLAILVQLDFMEANETPNELPRWHGPWQIVQCNQIYEDAWMQVQMDHVRRPDGNPGTYSTVRIKPGVCVIPVDSDGTCYLTKEFHYAVGRDTIEGISGGIEEGETPEGAAYRELQEEVGILASQLRPLGVVDPLTSALSSPTALFLATQLQFTQSNPDATEKIERLAFPFSRVVEMVFSSSITHGPSCVAILKANRILNP